MNIRASLIVVRATRGWRSVVGGVLAAALMSAWLGRSNAEFLVQVAYFGFPLIAIKCIADVFQYSQRASVWSMLAQRTETDARMMWSLLGAGFLVYLCVSTVLLLALVIGGVSNPELTSGGTRLLLAALWMIIVGISVATTSTLSRGGTAGFAILWLVMPFVNAFVQDAAGYSNGVRDAVNFLFPPIDSLVLLPKVLDGVAPAEGTRVIAQLIFFPLLCFAITHWRLKALANPDLPRIE